MGEPHVLMQLMRHEGWHAAQDCMAGTIENSMIAIIKPEEEVPMIWRVLAERTYPESAVPWDCLLYTSPSPRDKRQSRMPSSA